MTRYDEIRMLRYDRGQMIRLLFQVAGCIHLKSQNSGDGERRELTSFYITKIWT